MTSTSYSKEEVEKLLEEKLEERTQILRSELQASYKQELEDALGSQGKEPKYDRKDLRSEIQAAYTQELEVALGSQGKEPKYERKESGVTFALPPEAVKEDNADDADDADDFFVVDGEDNGLMKRKSVIDEAIDIGVEIPLLPEDTFSFFAFSRKSSTSLVAAVFVICFQLISLSLIGLDMFSAGTPENRLGVPIRVSPATSTIQVLALLISVFSQTDYQDSLNTLYSGHENQRWEERLGVPVPYWRWQASLWIRFCVSLLGLVMTFLLIVSESDASELLLDFTAIEFITNLDNIFFWLCAWGYLGIEAQRDAARVALATPNRIRPTRIDRVLQDGSIKTATHLTVSAGDRPDLSLSERDLARRWSMRKSVRTLQKKLHPSRFPRFQFLCVLCFAAIIGWAVVFYRQVTGYYVCNYAYVEFSDFIAPELASFNGFYEQIANGRRNEYVEVGHGKFSKTVRFGFCLSLQGWTFSYAEDDDICQWQTKSADMSRQSEESYILVGQENSAWTIKDHRDRVVPLTDLVLKCMDCKHDTSFCGERGTCVVRIVYADLLVAICQ